MSIDRPETERLILRKAEDRDLMSIWRNIWQDTEVARTMLWKPTLTLEDAISRLERTKKLQSENLAWFVCLKATDEPIGFCGVKETAPGEYEETGLCIGRKWQHKGLGKEMLGALVSLVFDTLGGKRFVYGCFSDNAASAALCKSLGFQYSYSGRFTREWDGYAYTCDFHELTKEVYEDRKACSRVDLLGEFYKDSDEDGRLLRSRHGQLEYLTTMSYIHRYSAPGSNILEVGAGTGRYSIALAKEGMDVTAVELLESNLSVLRRNGSGLATLSSCQGDAVDLSRFPDGTFDTVLVLGPMYHLYDPAEIGRAIDEAIRVVKANGVIMFAFISVYAVMYSNYFKGNWAAGREENFTADNRVRHFREQLFTGYDVAEFEALFADRPVTHITTAGLDGMIEPIEKRADFNISNEDFKDLARWHLAFAEKRELLAASNHLLYICRKNSI